MTPDQQRPEPTPQEPQPPPPKPIPGPTELVFDCPGTLPTSELAGALEEPANVVLVRDVGFDLSLPVFKDRIRACYHVECEPLAPTATKEEELARRVAANTSCKLVPGVRVQVPREFSDLDARETWNSRVRERWLSDLPAEELNDALEFVTGGGKFHGTTVAALVAYDSPNTKLVVVDDSRIALSGAETSCPSSEAFSKELAFLEDPDIAEARRTEPRALLDEQLDQVLGAYGVSVVNRSTAPQPRAALEKRCPGLDWEKFFTLSGEALTAHQRFEQATINRNVLSVNAAGNGGFTINSRADSSVCAPSPIPFGSYGEDSRDLVVGATRKNEAGESIAEFSNRGGCISTFVPGSLIVTSGPNGWLAVVSGTSVAAPLATRYVMNNRRDSFRAVDVYQDITQSENRFLAPEAAPEELIYELQSGAPLLF